MLNPFTRLDARLLQRLLETHHYWFVRQSYPRGKDPFQEGLKAALLLTHYDNINQAQIHFQAIATDPYAFLYETPKPEHLARLHTAAGGVRGYPVFVPILRVPWDPGPGVEHQIRRYVSQKLTWDPRRGDEIRSNLFVQFGEIFITLRYHAHEIKIPFADIERM
ncbi:hypothetical protein [Dinghuibacter silviterrae]|uniref:Uncharacterized protein n=1 Tax=Dinghuibacter silviterrae TaxID=1539049 RepID=A0A4R8DUL5_9BACT|nr:hypothetical protein [Dinghuibacter silviterrae]TDX02080.1 hypothetical protein EDB95_3129 [Dinghuibacter silviterrae]